MGDSAYQNLFTECLSEQDFKRLAHFIQTEVGIKMPRNKKGMLESRLRRRLRELGLDSYSEYCAYLFSQEGREKELVSMVDAVTTNKTDFFREPEHFNFLVQQALPELMTRYGAGLSQRLKVWSAGCSSGEEPYTLAIVLSEFGQMYPGLGFEFFILATDISSRVLALAQKAVYDPSTVEVVPMELKRRYMLKSKDRAKPRVRIRPELRERVRFRRVNFMDDDFMLREPMDLIFCRNVIIYFDKPTQEQVLKKITSQLRPGGYLFMGHSEVLNCQALPLVSVAPTVYRKIR